jgi:hypothetical protein
VSFHRDIGMRLCRNIQFRWFPPAGFDRSWALKAVQKAAPVHFKERARR